MLTPSCNYIEGSLSYPYQTQENVEYFYDLEEVKHHIKRYGIGNKTTPMPLIRLRDSLRKKKWFIDDKKIKKVWRQKLNIPMDINMVWFPKGFTPNCSIEMNGVKLSFDEALPRMELNNHYFLDIGAIAEYFSTIPLEERIPVVYAYE